MPSREGLLIDGQRVDGVEEPATVVDRPGLRVGRTEQPRDAPDNTFDRALRPRQLAPRVAR